MGDNTINTSAVHVWFRALRVHQWLKNLLIFIPLLAAHELFDLTLTLKAVSAFVVFCLMASSVYLLNDINDVEEDRQHPVKRYRPFASGRLKTQHGYSAAIVLLTVSLILAYSVVNSTFMLVCVGYVLITSLYTYLIRSVWIVDVVALALLYTIRIIAGGVATGLSLTFWILAFSLFIFFSLAMLKRFAELQHMNLLGLEDPTFGRGYKKADASMIASMGSTSGYLAVAVLALYINDLNDSALYSTPEVVWLACPVMLFWVTRIWMQANRGQITNDPLVYALKDNVSLMTGVTLLIIFWGAT